MHWSSLFGYTNDNSPMCYRHNELYTFGQFKQQFGEACHALRAELSMLEPKEHSVQSHTDCTPLAALYSDDSYEFCVWLFAALACGIQLIIPSNNKRATAQSLPNLKFWLGQWKHSTAMCLNALPKNKCAELLQTFTGSIQLFTSGSNGKPQRIEKTLQQLHYEIAAQQQHWGTLVDTTTVLATVSHQHIYGLLFKLLWPLKTGRTFVAKTYVNIANLLRDAEKFSPAVWIASPAQLSRRMENWPWEKASALRAIFSSGGPLASNDAEAITKLTGKAPIEIYGSTETGGIAWRRQLANILWQPLQSVEVNCTENCLLKVKAPWISKIISSQDRVQITDGGFHLLGRADQIIKIEEKRISLTQVENLLQSSVYISQVKLLPIKQHRECIAAVIVLNKLANTELEAYGKNVLVRKLRALLEPDLDGVAIPRVWRFVREIPVDNQGKSPRALLMQFFDRTPRAMLPEIETYSVENYSARISLSIPATLPCLPGHFEDSPIVPGVVQVDWAMHFGRELLNIGGQFFAMEVIKFKQLLIPEEKVQLELEFNQKKNKLNFRFHCQSNEYSSGKLCFTNV
ncbi:MAG: AMP-binding protein [Gammaproteobacteria bacterium]|nr:AMP-binding protein [Gammaproteobacteria bacterium]